MTLIPQINLDKVLEDCCPECGNVVFERKNHTQGCYCTKSECHYGYATTYSVSRAL